MTAVYLTVFLFVVVVAVFTCAQTTVSTDKKPTCYSGSTLYQKITQNCNEKDPSYTGNWYCATIEICESFISKQRECVETRGCATEQECMTTTTTSGYYDGTTVQVTSGVNPAGMTITATCCAAYDAPTDDAIAMDYSSICNSAVGNIQARSVSMVVAVAVVALGAYFVQ